jgi:hypothetical protein
MSTRSLTHIHEGKSKTPFVTIYRQCDGYPEGIGRELAEFLNGFTIVNGLGGQKGKIANGAGCLAAQLIKHFKGGPGNVYIYKAGSKDCWEAYTYRIRVEADKPITMEVYETVSGDGKSLPNKLLKRGTPAEILEWMKSLEDAQA